MNKGQILSLIDNALRGNTPGSVGFKFTRQKPTGDGMQDDITSINLHFDPKHSDVPIVHPAPAQPTVPLRGAYDPASAPGIPVTPDPSIYTVMGADCAPNVRAEAHASYLRREVDRSVEQNTPSHANPLLSAAKAHENYLRMMDQVKADALNAGIPDTPNVKPWPFKTPDPAAEEKAGAEVMGTIHGAKGPGTWDPAPYRPGGDIFTPDFDYCVPMTELVTKTRDRAYTVGLADGFSQNRKELERTTHELDVQRRETARHFEGMQKDLKSAREACDRELTHNRALSAELENTRQRLRLANADNKELSGRIDELYGETHRLKGNLDTTRWQVDQLAADNNELKERLDTAMKQSADMTRQAVAAKEDGKQAASHSYQTGWDDGYLEAWAKTGEDIKDFIHKMPRPNRTFS